MRGLNLDQLRALREIVRAGSFSGAARLLNLSQPAISLQIRELETRLGVALLDRMSKRAFATPAGDELLVHVERMLGEHDAALEAMRRHREGKVGRARLGTSEAILTYMLPPLLRELRAAHPNLELMAVAHSTRRVVDRVLANEIDIGLVTMPVSEPLLAIEPVREDPFFALFPPDAKGLPKQADPAFMASHVYIADGRHTQTNRLVHGWFSAAGLTPKPSMEIDNSESIKSMVAAGLGVAILPREAVLEPAAKGELLIRPLDPPLRRQIALIRRRDKHPTLALTIVTDALRTLAHRDLPKGAPRRRKAA